MAVCWFCWFGGSRLSKYTCSEFYASQIRGKTTASSRRCQDDDADDDNDHDDDDGDDDVPDVTTKALVTKPVARSNSFRRVSTNRLALCY